MTDFVVGFFYGSAAACVLIGLIITYVFFRVKKR